jgi:peptidoglycan/LPS O-acetylase OafA/YrhL
MLFFTYIGRDDMGRSVAISLGMIMLAVRIRWDLRRRFWFWGIVVLVLLLHVPLFFLVQWPKGWFYHKGMLPVALVDLVIILGAVRLVEKFIFKNTPPDEEE